MTDAQISAYLDEPYRSIFEKYTAQAEAIERNPERFEREKERYRSICDAISDLEDRAFERKHAGISAKDSPSEKVAA